MTDKEQDRFEAELRQMRPAKPPEDFLARMLAAKFHPEETARPASPVVEPWKLLLRWLIPATAVLLVAAAIWRGKTYSTSQRAAAPESNLPILTADEVQIGQELISSFDAVARLPGGEPVRFRFQQWMDEIVLNDTTQGLMVESRTPRIEVVALGFETY